MRSRSGQQGIAIRGLSSHVAPPGGHGRGLGNVGLARHVLGGPRMHLKVAIATVDSTQRAAHATRSATTSGLPRS